MRSVSLILLYYIGIPFATSFLGIFLGEMTADKFGNYLLLAVFSICGLIAGYFSGKGKNGSTTFQKRYLPVYLPLFLTVSSSAILMLPTKGYFGNSLWNAFIFLEFPFLQQTRSKYMEKIIRFGPSSGLKTLAAKSSWKNLWGIPH